MIEFESVSKTFRDGTTAVKDLTFVVPSDKITVVVGPSGCGKTTTLRMVNRMIEPTAGRIPWDGNPLKSRRKTSLRRQMGYVIQSGGLFPHRTVVENIEYRARPPPLVEGQDPEAGATSCSAASAWTASWPIATRLSCPAASSSGSGSRGRSRPIRWCS